MQIIAYAPGVIAIAGIVWRKPVSAWLVSGSLAAMWLFTGIAYHWLAFATINPVAVWFGAAFVLEAALLVYAELAGRLRFGGTPGLRNWVGAVLIAYALILYPLVGVMTHGYAQSPLFGVTPCPVTIFTLGCLPQAAAPLPWSVLVIPLLWSLIGGSAALLLNIPQDWLLLASGAAVLAAEMARRVSHRGALRV